MLYVVDKLRSRWNNLPCWQVIVVCLLGWPILAPLLLVGLCIALGVLLVAGLIDIILNPHPES